MLVDGNQTFFKAETVESSAAGADAAVQSLKAEALEAAEAKHKNDLTADIRILIHIFIDLKRLANELTATGLISSQQKLFDFTQAVTASQPLLSLVDCGPTRGSVGAKITGDSGHQCSSNTC